MKTVFHAIPLKSGAHFLPSLISAATSHLRHGSGILENLIANDDLLVVSAKYSLETGKVEFFDVP